MKFRRTLINKLDEDSLIKYIMSDAYAYCALDYVDNCIFNSSSFTKRVAIVYFNLYPGAYIRHAPNLLSKKELLAIRTSNLGIKHGALIEDIKKTLSLSEGWAEIKDE